MHNVEAIIAKYGSFEKGFLSAFSTSTRHQFPSITSACECLTPSLNDIDNAYGSGSAVLWLSALLIDIAAYTGIRENFTDLQIEACANELRNMSPDIMASEMLVFLSKFCRGSYESFLGYSHPNPQVILKSFRRYLDELLEIQMQVDEHLKAEEYLRERAQWEKNKAKNIPENIMKMIQPLIDKENWQKKTAEHKGRVIK